MRISQREIRERIEQIALDLGAEKMAAEKRSSQNYWKKLGSAELLCLAEDKGGGDGVLHNWNLCSELLPWGLDVPGVVAHNDAAASYLKRCSQSVKDTYITRLRQGDCIATVAITEPSSGSNTKGMASTIHQVEESRWVLNATKEWITNAPIAGLFFVVAVHADGALKGKTSVIAVDGRNHNVTTSAPYSTTCLKSSFVGAVSVRDLQISAEDFVGTPGSGAMQMMFSMARERTSVAAVALATSRILLDWTISWAKNRQVGGGLLAGKQAVSHRLSLLEAKLTLLEESLRSMLLICKGNQISIGQATRLKLVSTELQKDIATACTHLFGAESFRDGSFIARQAENARVQSVYAGTSEIMSEMIANELGLYSDQDTVVVGKGGARV